MSNKTNKDTIVLRQARVYVDTKLAGYLIEQETNDGQYEYLFKYLEGYNGSPVSLTMPIDNKEYFFKSFPPFFDGLLPEGGALEALLKNSKIDRNDLFTQLVKVGQDLVGNVTVVEDR